MTCASLAAAVDGSELMRVHQSVHALDALKCRDLALVRGRVPDEYVGNKRKLGSLKRWVVSSSGRVSKHQAWRPPRCVLRQPQDTCCDNETM